MFELGVLNTIFWCIAVLCIPLFIITFIKGKNLLGWILTATTIIVFLVNLSLAVDHRWLAFLDKFIHDWTHIHDYVLYGCVLLDVATAIALFFVRKVNLDKKLLKIFVIANLSTVILCNTYNFYTGALNYKIINTSAVDFAKTIELVALIGLYLRLLVTAIGCVILSFIKNKPQETPQPILDQTGQLEDTTTATTTEMTDSTKEPLIIEENINQKPISQQETIIKEEIIKDENIVEDESIVEQSVVEDECVVEQQEIPDEITEEQQLTQKNLKETTEIIEETIEEIVEETVEEIVEETVEEIEEEQPIDEQIQEVIEETIVKETTAQETITEETIAEETIAEETIAEQPPADEQIEQKDEPSIENFVQQLMAENVTIDDSVSNDATIATIATILQQPANQTHKPAKKLSRAKRKIRQIQRFVNYINESQAERQIPNMFCRNCGTRTHSQSKICPRCFNRMSPLYKCPRCNTLNETRLCTNCGTKMPRRR